MIARGDFAMSDMRQYVEKIQSKARFTPWSKKAMKIGLCDVPPIGHKAGMLSLFNTSAMANLFTDVCEKFKMLYNKKVSKILYDF